MEMQLPELGEGILEAEVVQWLVKPGDTVAMGQNIVEVLTDKATIDLPAPFAGEVVSLQAEPGDSVAVGEVLLAYKHNGQPKPELVSPAAASIRVDTAARVSAAPSVRRKARELGVQLTKIIGSGPSGRILIGDLTRAAAASATSSTAHSPIEERNAKDASPTIRQPMRGVRRKIAQQMVRATSTIPHYSYIDECDVTRLVQLRDELKPLFADRGVKLTYLPFVLKAVAAALAEVPLVNSSFDEATSEIILHQRCNIGIAVATDHGLIVPVLHDVDRMSFGQIARELERLTCEARSSKSKLADLRGGTFTVTSIGSIGGLISTPIINHPEVGILGTGKIVRRPVYDDRGELKPADMMYLSLSFDHRVVDGAVGAEFGNAVIRHLQKPAAMLIDETSLFIEEESLCPART